jgi:hypothetical protein
MPLDQIRDPLKLMRALNAYAYAESTPPELAEKLQTIPGVDADRITAAREIMYAHFDVLDEAGKTVLGQLADYAVYSGWSSENTEGRCDKSRDAVRRDLGEEGDLGDPADDPAPRVGLREDGVDWRNPGEEQQEPPVPPPAGE